MFVMVYLVCMLVFAMSDTLLFVMMMLRLMAMMVLFVFDDDVVVVVVGYNVGVNDVVG